MSFAGTVFLGKDSTETTAGGFAIEEVDPLGTPLHVHANEDDSSTRSRASTCSESVTRTFAAGSGALVFAPRHVPHAHRRMVQKTRRFLTGALAFWIRRVLPRTLQGAKCRRSGAGDERARFEEIRITRLKRAGSMRPCRSRRRRTVFALEPLGEIGEHWPRLVGPYQLGPGRWRLKRARGRVSWSSLAPSRLEAPASEEPEQREHHDYDQDDH